MQTLSSPQTELLERLIGLAGSAERLHRALDLARSEHGAALTLEMLIEQILKQSARAEREAVSA